MNYETGPSVQSILNPLLWPPSFHGLDRVWLQMEWKRDHARIHSREEELYVKYVRSQFLLLFTVLIGLNFGLHALGRGRKYLKISYTHDMNHVPTLIKPKLIKLQCSKISGSINQTCWKKKKKEEAKPSVTHWHSVCRSGTRLTRAWALLPPAVETPQLTVTTG